MTLSVSLLLLGMISIQTGAGLAKHLFPVAGAAGTTLLRLAFATLILWTVYHPWRFRFTKVNLKILCGYGASLGLMNLTFYLAIQKIHLGLAVTIEFIGPLVMTLILSRQKMDFLWALLAAVGIYLVVPHAESGHPFDGLGAGLALVAGIFWALYIQFAQRGGSSLHGGTATTVAMTIATLVVLPFALVRNGESLLRATGNLSALLPTALLVGLLSSAVPYTLEMMALKKIPAKTFGILMSLAPAVASLVGLVLLGEQLLPTQWLAVILVIAASLGAIWTAARVQKSQPRAAVLANSDQLSGA